MAAAAKIIDAAKASAAISAAYLVLVSIIIHV